MDVKNIDILRKDGVGVIPTDTVYGLVCKAFSAKAVERISQIKNRTDGKGFIVLINSIEDLAIFGVKLSDRSVIEPLNKFWPGKVSVEFYSSSSQFDYLKKVGGTIAFRLPEKKDLRDLLQKVGFLVAASANPEGQPPAKNVEEAKKYFGDKVDFYEDGGALDSLPSTLIKIGEDNHIQVLREGAVKI